MDRLLVLWLELVDRVEAVDLLETETDLWTAPRWLVLEWVLRREEEEAEVMDLECCTLGGL